MRLKKIILFVVLLLGSGAATLEAQEATISSGGDASGSGGSISYTVGQVMYTTNAGISGSLAQGVQQPYEISVLVGIGTIENNDALVFVYPNPATDLMSISISSNDIKKFNYQLFDLNGKLIESKKIEDHLTKIDMSALDPAGYFLKVVQNNKEVKTFIIIKN
jgi:hypothetical protein